MATLLGSACLIIFLAVNAAGHPAQSSTGFLQRTAALAVCLSLRISEESTQAAALATWPAHCGEQPVWVDHANFVGDYLAFEGLYGVCTALNNGGFRIPGSIDETFFPPICRAASPAHPTFTSATFKVLQYPANSQPMIADLHSPEAGLRSIRDPECALQADTGLAAEIDPKTGPLWVAQPGNSSSPSQPGAYIEGMGFRNGWMAANVSFAKVVVLRKIPVESGNIRLMHHNCFKNYSPLGLLLDSLPSSTRINCAAQCFKWATCRSFQFLTSADYFGLLKGTCKLYDGQYVGNRSKNSTVCFQLVDYAY